MRHVLTLVSQPLTSDHLVAARDALRGAGVRVGDVDPLADGHAVDLHCEIPGGVADFAVALAAVDAALAGTPVDRAVQERGDRRKKLLLADMESTVIRNEMLDELADVIGCGERVAEITIQAMRGELDFRAALEERLALLAGQPESRVEEVRSRIVVDPGAAALVATMKAHGARAALVSGGFTCFADPIAAELGFDEVHANVLGIEDGVITGRVVEPVLDRDSKLTSLRSLCAELGIAAFEVAAVGDGANDLPMLKAAGLGVAFHGKPKVAAAAGFRVDHGDLSTLLYYQGFRAHELRGALID